MDLCMLSNANEKAYKDMYINIFIIVNERIN